MDITFKLDKENADALLEELLGDLEAQEMFEQTPQRIARISVLEAAIVSLQKGLIPVGSRVRSRSIEVPAHGTLAEYKTADDHDKWGFGIAVVGTDDGGIVELPMMWLEKITVVE